MRDRRILTLTILLPIFVGLGAADQDTEERLWTLKEGV